MFTNLTFDCKPYHIEISLLWPEKTLLFERIREFKNLD